VAANLARVKPLEFWFPLPKTLGWWQKIKKRRDKFLPIRGPFREIMGIHCSVLQKALE
jgi:hypothetical protein